MKESVYEEARDDERATPVAIVTVAASILIFALGGYLMIAIEFDADWEAFWKSVLAGSAIGFGLWLCWVGVTRFVLASVFAQEIDVKALARVHGLAAAPSIIGFAMLIPLVSFGFALIGIVVWVLSTTLAIQSAFRIPLRSAIWSNLAGFAIWSLVIPVIATTENPLGPGIFWFDWTKDFTATIADLFEGLGSE